MELVAGSIWGPSALKRGAYLLARLVEAGGRSLRCGGWGQSAGNSADAVSAQMPR